MIPLPLVVAGLSLGASTLSWFNERKRDAVVRELQALQQDRTKVITAAHAERVRLGRPYIIRLQQHIADERRWRRGVSQELSASLDKFRDQQNQVHGRMNGLEFLLVLLELEEALARVLAEVSYLERLEGELRNWPEGPQGLEVPSIEAIEPPPDYPRDGLVVTLPDSISGLHGYRLELEPGGPPEGPVALFQVDHKRRAARACRVKGALVSALTGLSDGALEAEVTNVKLEETELNFHGVRLRLSHSRREHPNRAVGEQLAVYPGPWSLREVLSAGSRPGAPQRPLEVSVAPLIGPQSVHDLPLEVKVSDNELLIDFIDEANNKDLMEEPWNVVRHGEAEFLFYLGSRAKGFWELAVSPRIESHRFVLERIRRSEDLEPVGLRMKINIHAFNACTTDERELDTVGFQRFIRALHTNLDRQETLRKERAGALELQKLAMVFEDLGAWQRERSEAAICVTSSERKGGVVICETILLESPAPRWLERILNEQDAGFLSARTRGKDVPLQRVGLRDARAGVFELIIDESKLRNTNPSSLTQLVDPSVGRQEETFARAIEDTMVGRYVSGTVCDRLLDVVGPPIAHELEGHAAILEALKKEPTVFAVWGPPGAGKTTLIVEILQRAIRGRNDGQPFRALVAAPTHVAVDEILARLLQAEPDLASGVVRYAKEENIRGSKLRAQWHQPHVDACSDLAVTSRGLGQRWRELVSTHLGKQALARWLFDNVQIHGATCTGMTRRDFGLFERVFDLVILDEAGKALLPEFLIPARRARRLIVVGDHMQLPPTLTRETFDALESSRLPRLEVERVLRENAFERFFARLPANQKGMLSTQFRMAPEIGEAVSEIFYGGQLKSGRAREAWPLMPTRLVFVDFSKTREYVSQRRGSSQHNSLERRGIRVFLEALRERSDGAVNSVLVICPYKAQREALEHELARCKFPRGWVEVRTVDAVQGGEADLVVLAMTRHRGDTNFLLDRHRFNVALSRAREAFVVFGHAEHLCRDSHSPARALLELGLAKRTLMRIHLPAVLDWNRDLLSPLFR
jgi:hypothetical protein